MSILPLLALALAPAFALCSGPHAGRFAVFGVSAERMSCGSFPAISMVEEARELREAARSLPALPFPPDSQPPEGVVWNKLDFYAPEWIISGATPRTARLLPAPAQDTSPEPRITPETFDRIKLGMSRREVYEILDGWGPQSIDGRGPASRTSLADTWFDGPRMISVHFTVDMQEGHDFAPVVTAAFYQDQDQCPPRVIWLAPETNPPPVHDVNRANATAVEASGADVCGRPSRRP
jgi:hypothetical protein